ncbi:MAG: sulfite exporter TauE/SafE family protein [Bryobacteraceae bacterium]|jgi:uncharacterized membrane protein YfcA
MKAALLVALAIFTVAFTVFWIWAIVRHKHGGAVASGTKVPSPLDLAIGFAANFLDTLGIGSFATTTAMYKLFGLVRDEEIPGTLNVGHTLPSICEAFIFLVIVQVDVATLVLMIGASVVGAWLGAGAVSHWPRRRVQVGMGSALLGAAALMVMSQLSLVPGGGELLGLTGTRLALAVACNCLFGALMTIGIGLYAPCMMVIYLLGMNPRAAFPIMMGSCAFLMPVGSVQFIRAQKYNLKSALGLAIGGVPGVLLAAFVVKSLPLAAVRWLVVAVVVYTAAMMLRSAAVERRRAGEITGAASSAVAEP